MTESLDLPVSPPSEGDVMYLDLLKKCLTRALLDDTAAVIPRNNSTPWRAARSAGYALMQRFLSRFHLSLMHTARPTGETMMGMGALTNLQQCVQNALVEGVPGDFCETGVWRGGGCIFMRAMLKIHGDTRRIVWAADSFEGLPKPNAALYPADADDELWKQSLAVSLEEVKANFAKYNLLDDQVRFLKGFFSDTMPSAPIQQLAVLRLDGDMYESTIVVLRHLYPRLSIGGYVIIDDYGMIPGCNKAVEDFRAEQNVTEPLEIIGYVNGNPLGAFWKRLR